VCSFGFANAHIFMAQRLDTAIMSITALGLLYCASVGNVADISEEQAAYVCRVKMSKVFMHA
jgi:hypothetical protein